MGIGWDSQLCSHPKRISTRLLHDIRKSRNKKTSAELIVRYLSLLPPITYIKLSDFIYMGRKKSSIVSKPPFRPFCYYCERDFENEKVLIQHQKLKHFQCYICHRKSDTARGLVGHMLQVHKDSMRKVPNAIVGREDPEIVIHGLDGVPNHILAAKAKGTTYEEELARKRALEYTESLQASVPQHITSSNQAAHYGAYFPFPIPPPANLIPVPPIGMCAQFNPSNFAGLIPPPPPPPPLHPPQHRGVPQNNSENSKYVT